MNNVSFSDNKPICVSPFRSCKTLFGDTGEQLRDAGDFGVTLLPIEPLLFSGIPRGVIFVEPLICLSLGQERGDSKEAESTGIPRSRARFSGVATPAVAPAAFLAPSIAIGSADLIISR